MELEARAIAAPSAQTTIDQPLTAGDMVKLCPDPIRGKPNPAQTFRDLAKSAINGKGGKQKLAEMGYEAYSEQIGNKKSYFFRAIASP